MRYFVLVLLCLLCQSTFPAEIALRDSLLQQLVHSTDLTHKATILRNLADIYYELPQEQEYLKQLVDITRETGDQEMLTDALANLTNSYIDKVKLDSARYYLNEIQAIGNSTASTCWQTYLKMRLFDAEVQGGSESNTEAINQRLRKQTAESQKNKTIYEAIENGYIIASGLEIQNKYKEALPYCLSTLNMAAALPFKEGIMIRTLIRRTLQLLYIKNGEFEKVTPLVEEYIALREEHYRQYLKKERPFYPIESFRISDYATLIINIRHLSTQKANFYLQYVMDWSTKAIRPKDKYNCFLTINNYYLFKKDYLKALAANDSLIEYAKTLAPYRLPTLYNVNSQIYEVLGSYKEALQALKSSYAMQDSLTTVKSGEQLNKLQVQYDLNELNYENSQLEIKNKQIMLISLSVVLLISVFVSVYLYSNLKKEKIMKARMRILKNKAEESENLKIAFINSVCHEIRTPLNSIVGFTGLAFDYSIDQELRETFPDEVQKNAQLLTGLIDSMLEISNLDVSDEKLPCLPTDITRICSNEIERIQMRGKPEISFHLSVPEEPLIIPTNAQYLALVLENLLSNANKFSASGTITLGYEVDNKVDCLRISVTDTGCGIPPEKHEEVFDRFTKLDSFIPGNGLGLYLCRLIIKRLSGTIAIDAAYQTGTRIVASLPMH